MYTVFERFFNRHLHIKKSTKEFIIINIGILFIAMGIHFFKNPNKFALGGISGISILLSYYFEDIPMGGLMLGINVVLIAVSYFVLGGKFASKTIYGSFSLSFLVMLLEFLFPMRAPFTDQKLVELLYGVFLPGFGSALVFHYGATTGGTDVVAKMLSKWLHMKMSMALLLIDFSIALYAGVLFGVEVLLFSLLGVGLRVFAMDSILESLTVFKIVVIISDKNEEIKNFICNELERGATIYHARGAYTVQDREVITTVVARQQARLLQKFVNQVDKDAFITISNSSKIIGKGFSA